MNHRHDLKKDGIKSHQITDECSIIYIIYFNIYVYMCVCVCV